jgi:hypothetical protein
MDELARWLESRPAEDKVDQALEQLNVHGLVA